MLNTISQKSFESSEPQQQSHHTTVARLAKNKESKL
jgi:hypothetical protein